jgi:acyl-CoA synthetase (NDP forming)
MLNQAPPEKRTLLNEVEAKNMLQKAGIPVVETRLARTKKEAVAIGGVKLGLTSLTQVGNAYTEITSSVLQKMPQARIEGVSVQKMARPGVELIIGMNHDPQFGPVLMFGLGGILVEVLKDVSFRLVPITLRDAAEMVREIKGFVLLQGYRGQEPVNIPYLEELLVKVSNFIEKNPQIKELDLNPLFAYQDSIVAVDARIVLE